MTVRGDLRDMDLTSIIAINCNEMNQARLVVRHEGREARIFFQDGNIVHMSLEPLEGEEVIYEVLGWDEGMFQLERGVATPKRTVSAGWSELLLQGMQRLDERERAGGDGYLERTWDGRATIGQSELNSTTEGVAKDLERGERDSNEGAVRAVIERGEAELSEGATAASGSAEVADEGETAAPLKALADALFRMGLERGLSADQAVLEASGTSLPPFISQEDRREFKDLLLEAHRESVAEQAAGPNATMMLEEDEEGWGK